MFQETVKEVVKSSGSATLHPVPDLSSANRFETLCLVKRKRNYFGKNAKMIPTQIKLNDLFEEDLAITKTKSTVIMEKFSEKPSATMHGNIDKLKIKSVNLNINGYSAMRMTIELGGIIKNERDWGDIQESLKNKTIKLNHPLLKEIDKSSRVTLCVVLESLVAKDGLDLSEDKAIIADVDAKEHKSKESNNNSAGTAKGDIGKKVINSFKIPPNTVLAYSCNEISIDFNSGMASLHSAVDINDDLDEQPSFWQNVEPGDLGFFDLFLSKAKCMCLPFYC